MAGNKPINGDLTVDGNVTVKNELYGFSWAANEEVPTKDAVYDKIESLSFPHGNHTGHVTSVGLASTLVVAAITGQTEGTTLTGTDEFLYSDAGVIKRIDMNRFIVGQGTALTSGLVGTDELLISDAGVIKRMDVSVMNAYFNANLTFYTHPNHSGHISSVADGATTLLVAAITGQTALTSGLVGTDELLVSDGGVIKRMDVSVMNAYFNANLTFYSHPNHTGHVTSTGDGATVLTVAAITGQTAGTVIAGTDEFLYSDGGVIKRCDFNVLITGQTALTSGLVSTDELLVSDAGTIKRMDISVIEAYMQANLTASHGNHTGHVTSVGLATTLVVAAITGQTAGTVINGTDEFLYSDGGVIKRMDVNVLITGQTTGTIIDSNVDYFLYSDGGSIKKILFDSLIAGQNQSMTSGIVSTDEMLISDGGLLKKMDISVLNAYVNTLVAAAAGGGGNDIIYDHLPGNDEYSGEVIDVTYAATYSYGDLVCWSSVANQVILADAGNLRPAIGIVVEAGTSGKVLIRGFIEHGSFPNFAFAQGQRVYMSETAGDVSIAPPTSLNHYSQVVGVPYNTYTLYVNPSMSMTKTL